MKSLRPRLIFGFVALLIGVTACQLILGLDEPKGQDRVADAASEEAAAVVRDDCVHEMWPPPPPNKAPPTSSEFNFWVGLRQSSIAGRITGGGFDGGVPVRNGPFGYDIDNTCTCFKGVTARDGGFACLSKCNTTGCDKDTNGCDPDGGVDNSSYRRLSEFGITFNVDNILEFTEAAETGMSNLMIHVASYNGLLDDENISIHVVVSDGVRTPFRDLVVENGTVRGACDGGVLPAYNPADELDAGGPAVYRTPPEWKGCEQWAVKPQTVTSGSERLPTQDGLEGYVTNGILVVRYTQSIDLILSPEQGTKLSNGVMTARIVPFDVTTGATLTLPVTAEPGKPAPAFRLDDGILSGRVPSSAVLHALGSFKSTLTQGKTICTFQDGGFMKTFRDVLCEDADLLVNSQSEFVPPLAKCNASSFAFAFLAVPVGRPKPLDPAPLPPDPCSGSSPTLFTCE